MFRSLIVLLLAGLLGGCAAMNRLSSEVATFGDWPAGQSAPSFVFDRLPSQPLQTQQMLEQAALPALRGAGFSQAADPARADYVVQLGASITAEPGFYDDFDFDPRFGWSGGWYPRRFGLRHGWGFGYFAGSLASPTYQREVVVLVRERQSGRTVYETRASNSGYSPLINSLLPAMFQAAMADFPNPAGSRRQIVTPIGG